MALDYDELEHKLRTMKPRTKLYELVKAEMVRRGNWKNRIRGFHVTHNPQQAKSFDSPEEYRAFMEKYGKRKKQ